MEQYSEYEEDLQKKALPGLLRVVMAAGAAGGMMAGTAEAASAEPTPVTPVATLQSDTNALHFRRRRVMKETGFVVRGATSTFGPPLEAAGQTADQGYDNRPCIAIRNDSTLGDMFKVVVLVNHRRHVAQMVHCDWGPAAWTGRNIDITGAGAYKLHLNPYNYPTGAWGIAIREVSRVVCIPGNNQTYPGAVQSDHSQPCPVL
ncbi:MAG TPA: hypothetical protein VFN51_02005 [Candidatus Saccharimonadales bacterium]|nr:hypothetical protein [Candidatus Saccharimonadales bacterium]